jgi:hypothetical protein
MEETYKAPTLEDLRELFGNRLQEEEAVEVKSSDVDEFVSLLEKASRATKEHSIQFG